MVTKTFILEIRKGQLKFLKHSLQINSANRHIPMRIGYQSCAMDNISSIMCVSLDGISKEHEKVYKI